MMQLRNIIFTLFLCSRLVVACQEAPPPPLSIPLQMPPEAEELVLFFCGDVMQHLPQVQSAYRPKEGDYVYLRSFRFMAPVWSEADFVVANLETTLANRDFSGYPRFCSPWQLVRDLRCAGVTHFVTANNHSCDRGDSGIRNTIYYLDSLQVAHTGVFLDSADYQRRHPLYLEREGFKVALLNYTYGTNGLPIPRGRIVSLMDTLTMRKDIHLSRQNGATHVITFLHWGYEYHSHPNREQKLLARWLHDQGVDIVVGSHPHVVQPLEYHMREKDTVGVTIYSLGNFVSNQQQPGTDGGIGVRLVLRNDSCRRYEMSYLNYFVVRRYERGYGGYDVVPEWALDVIPSLDSRKRGKAFCKRTDALLFPARKWAPLE